MNRIGLLTYWSFVILLFLQVFIFNSIYLGIYVNLQIYLMFILFMPATFTPLVVLFLSTAMGFAVDLFSSGDLGLHTAACACIGYLRQFVLRYTTVSDVQLEIPTISRHFRKYLIYAGSLILLHHIVLFSVETFEMKEFLYIALRTVLSAILNMLIISIAKLTVR
jgi:rod shape-determining protein MreD